jgi:hypothetical protein
MDSKLSARENKNRLHCLRTTPARPKANIALAAQGAIMGKTVATAFPVIEFPARKGGRKRKAMYMEAAPTMEAQNGSSTKPRSISSIGPMRLRLTV